MFDFTLTEEQLALRSLAREFVKKEIKPTIKEREAIADPRERMPWDIVEKLSKLGIRTLHLKKEYGGGGADCLTICMMGEELAVGDLGIAVICDQTWKLSAFFNEAMNDEQRERFVPDFVNDHRFLLAIGSTEPDTDKGYRYAEPTNVMGTGPRTNAKRDGKDWVINGTKHYISTGSDAKLYFVAVRTDPSKGGALPGVSFFIIPRPIEGFTIGRIEDKIGQRLINNAELVFQDCRVPDANILIGEGRAAEVRRIFAAGSNVEAGATALGCGRAAYEAALEWAKTRVQGCKPIIEHEAIGMMMADMAMNLEVARNMLWKAAWSVDHPEKMEQYLVDYKTLDPAFDLKKNNPLTSLAKVFASETAVKVAIQAMEIFGGFGIMRDGPVEKCVRDALTFLHSDGTNQIHRMRAAQLIAGQSLNY